MIAARAVVMAHAKFGGGRVQYRRPLWYPDWKLLIFHVLKYRHLLYRADEYWYPFMHWLIITFTMTNLVWFYGVCGGEGDSTYVYIKAGSNPWPDAENWSDNITRVRQARQGKEEIGQARAAACWHARASQSLLNLMIDKPQAGKTLAFSVNFMIKLCCKYIAVASSPFHSINQIMVSVWVSKL